MRRPIKYQLLKLIITAAGNFPINAESDKSYKKVTGIHFSSSDTNALKDSVFTKLDIDSNEIFPEGFEVKMIRTGEEVPPNDRFLDLDERGKDQPLWEVSRMQEMPQVIHTTCTSIYASQTRLTMTTQDRRKYHIILVEVITSGGAQKVNFKIPSNVKHCKGFMFSANEEGLAAKNYLLGNVSLFINDRKSHPLHYAIHSKPLGFFTRKNEILKLDECIKGGSFIQGYYKDLGIASSYPYKLRIYLETVTNG